MGRNITGNFFSFFGPEKGPENSTEKRVSDGNNSGAKLESGVYLNLICQKFWNLRNLEKPKNCRNQLKPQKNPLILYLPSPQKRKLNLIMVGYIMVGYIMVGYIISFSFFIDLTSVIYLKKCNIKKYYLV